MIKPPPIIALDTQLACVQREIRMRERVYPQWVETRRMPQATADAELAAMRAVAQTLREAIQSGDLFR